MILDFESLREGFSGSEDRSEVFAHKIARLSRALRHQEITEKSFYEQAIFGDNCSAVMRSTTVRPFGKLDWKDTLVVVRRRQNSLSLYTSCVHSVETTALLGLSSEAKLYIADLSFEPERFYPHDGVSYELSFDLARNLDWSPWFLQLIRGLESIMGNPPKRPPLNAS